MPSTGAAPSSPVACPSPSSGAARPHLGLRMPSPGASPITCPSPSPGVSPVACPSPLSGAACPHLGLRPHCPSSVVIARDCTPSPGAAPLSFVTLAWGCTPSTGAALSSPITHPSLSPSSSIALAWGCMPSPGVAPSSFVIRRPRLGLHAVNWGSAVVACHPPLVRRCRRSSPLPGGCTPSTGVAPSSPVAHRPSVILVWARTPSPGAVPSSPVASPCLGLHGFTWGGALIARCPCLLHTVTHRLSVALVWGCTPSPGVAPLSPIALPGAARFHLGWRPRHPSPVCRPHLGRMRQPPSKEASPQDHGWQRCSASVDRLMCGLVGLAHGLDHAGLWPYHCHDDARTPPRSRLRRLEIARIGH
jgi:hypothetical protein